MTIGFNIEYKEDISDNIYVDSYKYEVKNWLNDQIINIAWSLNRNEVPLICTLDMLGNCKDGYDFNDIYTKYPIYSINDFLEFWSKNWHDRILKNNIKHAMSVFSGYHKDGIPYNEQFDY